MLKFLTTIFLIIIISIPLVVLVAYLVGIFLLFAIGEFLDRFKPTRHKSKEDRYGRDN